MLAEELDTLGGSPAAAPQMADRVRVKSIRSVDISSPDVSGGGVAPTLNERTVATGTAAGATNYRSEIALPGNPYIRATEGWRTSTEFDLHLSDGFASQPDTSWNVVYQTHGRLVDQSWPQPPVELNFQKGSYRVSSSSHAPNSAGQLVPAFDESMPRIVIPDPVGAWHRWRIDVVLGGAGRGYVNAWCDGEQVVDMWFPVSGTYYAHPNNLDGTPSPYRHEWVYTKIGLYGAGTHSVPRTVQHRNIVFETRTLDKVIRYEMAAAG